MSKSFAPKVGDLVYFRWDDHCSYHGCAWTPSSEIGKRLTASNCETVGFVVDLTRECITTVAHVTVNDEDNEPDVAQVATRLRKTITHWKIIKRFKQNEHATPARKGRTPNSRNVRRRR